MIATVSYTEERDICGGPELGAHLYVTGRGHILCDESGAVPESLIAYTFGGGLLVVVSSSLSLSVLRICTRPGGLHS